MTPSQFTFSSTALACLFSLAVSSASAAPPEFAEQIDPSARVLVEPRAGLPEAAFQGIVRSHGASKVVKFGQSNLRLVSLGQGLRAQDMVERLRRNPHIRFAEADRIVKSTFVPNDPYYGSSWHHGVVGSAAAWDKATGTGLTVAILDSGTDARHADLKANLVPGYNVWSNNTLTSDVCGHGTAVAGVAAAALNNRTGVAGMAGTAKIMPVRIANYDSTNGCYATYSTVANGLIWAADNGARIANVSYAGLPASASVISAAQYLKDKGGLVVISAGNRGVDEGYTPTNAMVAVSATNSYDAKTSWSSYGNFVTIAAPGENIYSTNNGGGYGAWNGTSFSSPLVAGVAAMMLSSNPLVDGAVAESLLYATAKDLGALGRDPLFGHGRVDAAAAVAKAAAYNPNADVTEPTATILAPLPYSTATGLVPVDVSATDNVAVSHVQLKVNNTVVATSSAAPYGFTWDSRSVANGMVDLVAVAFDTTGNSKASEPVSVNVANETVPVVADTTPPALAVTNPVAGNVAGTVVITTEASDDSGAAGISQSIYVDGVLKASGTGSALSYSWNTKRERTGAHKIEAVARDKAGNASTSVVNVNVVR